MPNRIIRESSRTSPNLDQLSDFAERLFWRMTTVADDHGRFNADPRVITSDAFPLRSGKPSLPRRVSLATQELVQGSLIALYEVNGRQYGYFLTWEHHQRVRAEHSKYPDPPPEAMSGQMRASADNGGQGRASAPVVGSRSRESRTRVGADAMTGFEVFWTAYPKKKAKQDAMNSWGKLKPDAELQRWILTSLKADCASQDWLKAFGQYIPLPATWLNGRRWEDHKPPKSPEPPPPTAEQRDNQRRVTELTTGIGKEAR